MENNVYQLTINSINEMDWDKKLADFSDANIYQSWAYAKIYYREKKIRIALYRGKDLVAMALVRSLWLPYLNAGFTYVPWGPVWQKKGCRADWNLFETMAMAIKKEFSSRRGTYVRLLPNLYEDEAERAKSILESQGYRWRGPIHRTLVVDLTKPLEDIKAGLRRKWRQCLGYASKELLELNFGISENLLMEAYRVYKNMHKRKKFAEFVDKEKLIRVQAVLPNDVKLKTLTCKKDGETIGAIVWSEIGETGLPVLAATGDRGLKTHGSYLLWWTMIEKMREAGCKRVDLGGIDEQRNPGGYIFKSGIANKQGKDVRYIGFFDTNDRYLNRFAAKGIDWMKTFIRKWRMLREKLKD